MNHSKKETLKELIAKEVDIILEQEIEATSLNDLWSQFTKSLLNDIMEALPDEAGAAIESAESPTWYQTEAAGTITASGTEEEMDWTINISVHPDEDIKVNATIGESSYETTFPGDGDTIDLVSEIATWMSSVAGYTE